MVLSGVVYAEVFVVAGWLDLFEGFLFHWISLRSIKSLMFMYVYSFSLSIDGVVVLCGGVYAEVFVSCLAGSICEFLQLFLFPWNSLRSIQSSMLIYPVTSYRYVPASLFYDSVIFHSITH